MDTKAPATMLLYPFLIIIPINLEINQLPPLVTYEVINTGNTYYIIDTE